MTVYGQDWSSYQSSRPSTKGLDFVFIKATEGTGYTNPRMVSQASHARAAGCIVGFYHFLRPGNMKAQAAYFVKQAASLHGDPLWADWEDPGVSCHDKDTFLKEVKRLRGDSHKVGLYCNTSYWTSRDTTSYCADALWIATYNGHPGHPGIQHDWLFHQYTSTPVDKNYGAFQDRAALRAWAEGTTKEADPLAGYSKEDIARAVIETDGVHDVPERWRGANKLNAHWKLESVNEYIGNRVLDCLDKLDDVEKRISEVDEKLGSLDLSSIVKALESLKIHFEVSE